MQLTTNANVKSYLQYALLQLAAESYLHNLPINPVQQRAELIRRYKFGFNDPTHGYILNYKDVAQFEARCCEYVGLPAS